MRLKQMWLLSAILTIAASGAFAQSTMSGSQEAKATFAGGCFWCMEGPFDKLDGVISTVSGYAGGHVENPSYQEVTRGGTGHAEVVQVTYDPSKVDYETLLDIYWKNVDPFDAGGQFCDRGSSYRPAIFYHDREQRRAAERTKREVEDRFDRRVAAEIEELDAFYPAEDYHQNYYKTNSIRYRFYRSACGRDARLREIWGDEAGGPTADM